MKPLFKWAGGKQWLAPTLVELFNARKRTRLIEPFAGGASLFFGLESARAVLGDANAALIATYKSIKASAASIANELQRMPISADVYYSVRSEEPLDQVAAASRFIYLNRTAFGGLWRVNQAGEFNVPFGCKPETRLPDADVLRAYARVLWRARLVNADFGLTIKYATQEDFIYCDPPYTVSHNNNGFLRYNQRIFSWDDQCRLASICNDLANRGHSVVVSNAAHSDIAALFDVRTFRVFKLARPSNLAAKVEFRAIQHELLFVSKGVANKRVIESIMKRRANSINDLKMSV